MFTMIAGSVAAAKKTLPAINYPGNITIPTQITPVTSNMVWDANRNITFSADINIPNSNPVVGTGVVLGATNTSFGIENEFVFGVSSENLGRGIPAGRLQVYNGIRGGTLTVRYSDVIIPINQLVSIRATRTNGTWSLFIGGNAVTYQVVSDVPASDVFGNINLPYFIGRDVSAGGVNFYGTVIANVYAN